MKVEEVKAMSDTKLRFMVAKLAGLSAMEEKFDPLEMWDGQEVSMDAAMDGRGVPDYPRDLNAMYKVEETAFYRHVLWHRKYARKIHEVVIRDWNTQGDGVMETEPSEAGWFAWYLGTHATARQRAEAFVMTMGETK